MSDIPKSWKIMVPVRGILSYIPAFIGSRLVGESPCNTEYNDSRKNAVNGYKICIPLGLRCGLEYRIQFFETSLRDEERIVRRPIGRIEYLER